LTTLSSISILLVRQHAGEVNVSLFAVGLCCRDAATAVADRRQSLPPPTTAGPAAPQAAAAPYGFGPAFLDSGVSGWQTSLLIVKPETVLRWHRQGWRSYCAANANIPPVRSIRAAEAALNTWYDKENLAA
jgi:hypothetical protein